jgi:hypothetical protein
MQTRSFQAICRNNNQISVPYLFLVYSTAQRAIIKQAQTKETKVRTCSQAKDKRRQLISLRQRASSVPTAITPAIMLREK